MGTSRVTSIGFFRELPHGEPDGPSLLADRRPGPDAEAARIVEYLRRGALFIACPGLVEDVLDPDAGPIGAPHIMTDGRFAWPADLAHYVQRYHVRLPEAVIRHMAQNAWRVPDDIDVTLLELS